jgi:hypothetical protein
VHVTGKEENCGNEWHQTPTGVECTIRDDDDDIDDVIMQVKYSQYVARSSLPKTDSYEFLGYKIEYRITRSAYNSMNVNQLLFY